jgi:hypothetical protein
MQTRNEPSTKTANDSLAQQLERVESKHVAKCGAPRSLRWRVWQDKTEDAERDGTRCGD